MNSPFEYDYEYVGLDLTNVDKATVERAASVQVDRADNGRGFIAVSRAGACYQVDLLCDNSGYCNCPDFVFRKAKEGLPCKHIVALDRFLGGRA